MQLRGLKAHNEAFFLSSVIKQALRSWDPQAHWAVFSLHQVSLHCGREGTDRCLSLFPASWLVGGGFTSSCVVGYGIHSISQIVSFYGSRYAFYYPVSVLRLWSLQRTPPRPLPRSHATCFTKFGSCKVEVKNSGFLVFKVCMKSDYSLCCS